MKEKGWKGKGTEARNLSLCSRDARKPIAVPIRKLSVYLQPFRRSLF